MIHDDIDRHLEAAGSIGQAAVPIGVYVAWCVNLGLSSEALAIKAQHGLTRLKFRDIAPGEFFVAVCHGTFGDEDLNERGRTFTASYYCDYYDDLAAALGVDLDGVYAARDDWATYDAIAPALTKRLFGSARTAVGAGRASTAAKRRWWRVIKGGKS